MIAPPERRRVRFGSFEFDSQTGELFKDGRIAKLQPQPVRLLDLLISRAGELVTREELRDALWPDGTSVEFDQGLNFSIRQIRSALGESASNPVFLETLPKRGYRFIGDVLPAEIVPATKRPCESAAPSVRPPRAFHRYWFAAVAVAAIGLTSAHWQKSGNPAPPKSILVRPLRNFGLPVENTWYADSLTEQLIVAFSRFIAVRHVPGSASPALMNPVAAVPDPGPRFGADVIVDGSVRKTSNGIEVTIQVADTRAEGAPWSRSYTYETTDSARIEKQIADAITTAFQLQIRNRAVPETRRPPDDPDTYTLYRRAIAAHNGDGDLKASAEALEEVTRRAPKFAPAFASLANVWARAPWVRPGPRAETYGKAREYAQAALRLDPSSSDGHAALAHALFKLHKWREAENEFRLALTLEPNSATVLQIFAIYLTVQGRFSEAIERAQAAARLAPTESLMAYTVAMAHLHAGNYDKAIAESHRALQFGSTAFGFYRVMSRAYAMKGMISEAIAAIDEWEAKANEPQPLWRALVLAQGGDHTAARAHLQKWDAKNPGQKRPPYPYALALIELGETDRGFQALRTVAPGEAGVKPWMKQTPELKKWRDDPRFRVIVNEFDRESSD